LLGLGKLVFMMDLNFPEHWCRGFRSSGCYEPRMSES